MASLLRSGKFVRLISNFARNLAYTNVNRPETEGLLWARRDEWEIKLHRSLSTVQLPKQNLGDASFSRNASAAAAEDGVERALQRLDFDIRKSGRLSRSDVEGILQEIKQSKKVTSTQSLLLLRCCGGLIPEELPEQRTQLVQDAWNTLENLGVKLDVSHYNALLKVYFENEHKFDPIEFLSLMENKNVEPNRVTYQRLIAAYCQRGDIDGASKILETMKAKDLPINEYVFNSLIMGHAQVGDMESAQGIISVMKQAGIEPGVESFAALLTGYAKQGSWENIQKVLDDCAKNEVVVHDKDLFEVLYELAVNGHGPLVDNIISKLEKTTGFNQDCANTILRLVNRGCDAEAYKLLLVMKPAMNTEGNTIPTGIFFLRQLVKARIPAERILHYCDDLATRNLNQRAQYKVLEFACSYGYDELVTKLMDRLKTAGEQIRPQYFWSLFNSQSKVAGEEGVIQVLKQMAQLNVVPNVETVKDHVLPHLSGTSSALARKLRSAEVPSSVVASSLLLKALQQHDLAAAVQVASLYNVRLEPTLLRKHLSEAYLDTKDAENAALLLRLLVNAADWRAESEVQKQSVEQLAQVAGEIVGPVLVSVVSQSKRTKLESLQPLLEKLVEQGLGISNSVAQVLQEKIGDKMTETLSELLVQLSSGKLSLSPVNPKAYISRAYGNEPRSALSQKKMQFTQFAREHKLDEVLQLKQELEAENFVISVGMHVLLMDVYAYHGKAQEAYDIFSELTTKEPTLTLDGVKVLRLAAALLKQERKEDAFKVLSYLRQKEGETNPAMLQSTAWKMLSNAAESGDAELVKQLVSELEKSKAVELVGSVLGPVVKVYLNRDDIEGAVNAFEWCVKNYNCTPYKNPLTCRLIEKEDAQKLQHLMDLSVQVHGEMNSLYDLVFAFLDCGRIRQARKVLETPGLRARHQRLESACSRYVEDNRVAELENLVKITKDLFDVDRMMLYNYLLKAYMNNDEKEKALGLWTQLQEDDIQPSEGFLRTLGSYLQTKGVTVPFEVPKELQEPKQGRQPKQGGRAQQQQQQEQAGTGNFSLIKQFRQILNEGNVEAALSKKKEIESAGLNTSITDTSALIEALVKAERLGLATKLTLELLERNLHPLPQIFRFLTGRLSKAGDRESLESIGKLLTNEMKRVISYDNLMCAAHAGDSAAAATYLDSLVTEVEQTKSIKDEEEKRRSVEELRVKFPRGGAIAILENNGHLIPKFEQLVQKYLEAGIVTPLNVLWSYHMASGNTAAASEHWPTLKNCSGPIGFKPVCRAARNKNDSQLAETLVRTVSEAKSVTQPALGVAYSAWIDTLCAQEKYSEALEVLKEVTAKNLLLDDVNRSSLVKLQSGLQKAGKEFPYTIPARKKRAKNQTSSSDSDTD